MEETNPSQQKNDHKQSGDNQNISIDSPKTSRVHNSDTFLLSRTAQYKNSIPATTSYVKTPTSAQVWGGKKLGTETTSPNQPADKLINKSAIDFNQNGSNFISRANGSTIEKDLSSINDIVWVKIKSIEYVDKEQVYANGITAHNTYISDKLGIGATTPLQNLQVEG